MMAGPPKNMENMIPNESMGTKGISSRRFLIRSASRKTLSAAPKSTAANSAKSERRMPRISPAAAISLTSPKPIAAPLEKMWISSRGPAAAATPQRRLCQAASGIRKEIAPAMARAMDTPSGISMVRMSIMEAVIKTDIVIQATSV